MDATLVAGWEALFQLLSPAFTRPKFVTFVHIVTRWVLCRSKPTATSLICTIGSSLLSHATKHWTVYEKSFYRAAWSLPDVSRLLLRRVIVPLIDRRGVGTEIDLNIDDTTCLRCGKHVAWAGPFQTRQQIATQMIRNTRTALPDPTIRVAADGQYAA